MQSVSRWTGLLLVLIAPLGLAAQVVKSGDVAIRVTLVPMPYVGERNAPELSRGPDYLAEGGIHKMLEERGAQVKVGAAIKLSPEDDKAYGSWHRVEPADGDIAQANASALRDRD